MQAGVARSAEEAELALPCGQLPGEASLANCRHLPLPLSRAEIASCVLHGLERLPEVVALEFVDRRSGEGALGIRDGPAQAVVLGYHGGSIPDRGAMMRPWAEGSGEVGRRITGVLGEPGFCDLSELPAEDGVRGRDLTDVRRRGQPGELRVELLELPIDRGELFGDIGSRLPQLAGSGPVPDATEAAASLLELDLQVIQPVGGVLAAGGEFGSAHREYAATGDVGLVEPAP